MLIISALQLSKLNVPIFNNFVERMQESLKVNLENRTLVDFNILAQLINRIISLYSIFDEELIEDFLLLYYEFQVMQQDPLSIEISEILNNKTKNERLKMDELKSFLFCQTD
jgi:hypothetical protein